VLLDRVLLDPVLLDAAFSELHADTATATHARPTTIVLMCIFVFTSVLLSGLLSR